MASLGRFIRHPMATSLPCCYSTSAGSALTFPCVTVVGAGLMGSGIAQVAAQTGHTVTIVDTSEEALNNGLSIIKKSLARVLKKKHVGENAAVAIQKDENEILSRISTSVNPKNAVMNTDLVIEAIVENLQVKRNLFAELDQAAPPSAVFASNTSSIPISDIASSTKRCDRFGGLHFFNPVTVMKLLEVIRTPETSDETFQRMLKFGADMKKTTVECKDTPGFIVNRLLVPTMFEAIRMLERGDASSKDIDTSMKLGAGHPMGPFELIDYVGLDTVSFIMKGWNEAYPNESLFKRSPLLDSLVAEGKFGRKSGEGFYKY